MMSNTNQYNSNSRTCVTGGAIGHSQPNQSTEMITRKRELHKLCKYLYLIKKEMDKRNKEKLHQDKDLKKLINMSIFAKPDHISKLFGKFIDKIPLYKEFATIRGNYRYLSKKFKCLIHHKNKLYSVDDTSYDDTISIWNTETHVEIGLLKGHDSCVNCLVICENILYSGSDDCTIRSWDMETCREIAVYGITSYSNFEERPSHTSSISSIALHGNKLYSASSGDKTIRIWNTETHTQIAILKDVGRVKCIAVNKTKLYSASLDYKIIRIWNTETYEEMQSLEGHTGSVTCITLDENKLYSGSSNGTIGIWNTETYEEISILRGHTRLVQCITLHENKLYSAGDDKTIRVWNTKTCKEIVYQTMRRVSITKPCDDDIATMRGHSEIVTCITLHGNNLYSGSWDKTIRCWKIDDVPRKPVILEKKEIDKEIKNRLIRSNSDIQYAVDSWCFKNKNDAILEFGHISDWNTTQVDDMSKLFFDQYKFNDNISKWDVSNVKNMSEMFEVNNWNQSIFNQDISGWDVSKVETMEYMFCNAENFNCDLSRWDVKNVVSMRFMFNGAKKFDGNISTWVLKNIDRTSLIKGIFDRCNISSENKIQIRYYNDFWDDDCDVNHNYDCDEYCDDDCDGNHNYECNDDCDDDCNDENDELNSENKLLMEIKQNNKLYDDYGEEEEEEYW